MNSTSLINSLKLRRKLLKVTQQNLADLSGVGLGALKQIESGKGNPTLATMKKLCDVLGLEMVVETKKL